MATPRKHWFKVMDSIARDDLSNDEVATMIRLLGMLNTQWARDGLSGADAARITCRPADLMACTGSESLARARRIADALSVKVGLTVDRVGKQTIIFWPKCLELQGWDSPVSGNSKDSSPPRDSPSETKTKTKTKTETQEGAASPPSRAKGKKVRKLPTPCPDHLSDDEVRRVSEWAPLQDPPISPKSLGPAWARFVTWAHGKGERKKDWVAAFRNALLRGWVLDGVATGAESETSAERALRITESTRL